ncbi:alkaline phosphatase family protein [Saliphagus sp. LR7]|uniref:alkaline phosphatase family protein n=1 Tax=Saliphagus sp. LR7 TaxID=2282654 RepID=UPI000DF7C7F8|nr:alkaline phosphatase family protein [Saliphagus sp. LR7]
MEHADDPLLLVVGLDAACLPVLKPLFDRGVTPTLKALFEGAVRGPLESQIPPWTASAWPTLYTGKNPGKHGVFDFLTFDGYDWDVVNAGDVRERAIWELLSEHGHRSVVVNAPVTHPARPFDGALIPGMTAPENPACHPEGILADVEAACGEYHVYPQATGEPTGSIAGYEEIIECRGEAFRYLADRFSPDFGFLQFQQTDSVFHERPDRRTVEAVYRAVDREIEATLEAIEPANVLVVSDHGIGRVGGTEFRANEFLRREGYVDAESGGEGMPTWSRAWRNDLLSGADAGDHEPSTFERVVALAATVGITTQRVAGALDRVGLKEAVGRRIPNDAVRAGSEQVDFPASRAYVRSKSELGVRINLAGREPDGTVPPEEYERVRADLVEALSALSGPDGKPVFSDVAPREAYFEGSEIDRGPDIVTVPRGFDNALVAGLSGEVFAEPVEPWNHKRTGVIAATGPGIDGDGDLAGATILDVAPTICALFDVPIDRAMDGRRLPIAAGVGDRQYPDYEPAPAVRVADATVEERLSELGYL